MNVLEDMEWFVTGSNDIMIIGPTVENFSVATSLIVGPFVRGQDSSQELPRWRVSMSDRPITAEERLHISKSSQVLKRKAGSVAGYEIAEYFVSTEND